MAGVIYSANPATSSEPGFGLATRAYSAQYLEALYAPKAAWKHMRNFTADVMQFGESVSVPTFPSLTAVDVTSSTGAFSYDNTSITASTIVINHMKAVAHSVPEYIIKQSKIDVMSAFAKNAAKAVSDSIDAEMVELIAKLSANSAGSANSDLTEDYCLHALEALVTYHVPLSNPMDLVWVLPASQFAPVHGLKDYGSYTINAGSPNAEGGADVRASVDTLYGIDVVWRNDAAMTVTAGKIGGLFYKDSVGVAIQRAPSMRDPLPLGGTINTELLCHALFGINLMKETLACKILCK